MYLCHTHTHTLISVLVASLRQVWGMAMRHLRGMRRFPPVLANAVYLMLSCMPATGPIESHFFSYLQMLGGSRWAGTSLDNLRAQMKIMVDGPPDDDFVLCKRLPGGGAAYVASQMCREAQNHYFHEFGGKDFTVSDARANAAGLHTPAPRTHKGAPQKSKAGSKQHAVQQQLAELKRALA